MALRSSITRHMTYYIRWVWNCWKQSRIIINIWQGFVGFHTEAALSGHWENVSLTKYYKGTYQDGAAVDLNVDKERGCIRRMHVLTNRDKNRKKYVASHLNG